MRTRFTELVGCRVPIQSAGMGGAAGPELAGAVAHAGGLGMIGGVMVPAPALQAMLDGLDAGPGAIGVNFLMPFLDREAVEVAAARARVVEFFYDTPDPELVRQAHDGGALVCWQVGSAAEAIAAEAAGCDLIAVQGVEAGGHVRGQVGILPLLTETVDAVQTPLIAGGGVSTGRAVAALLAGGAEAARVGTRFLAAREADVHPEYLRRLLAAASEETELGETFHVQWPNAPHRALRSAVEAARAFAGEQTGEMTIGGQVIPIAKQSVECPNRATTGAIEAMALYAGQGVGMVQREETAAEILAELVESATTALARASGLTTVG